MADLAKAWASYVPSWREELEETAEHLGVAPGELVRRRFSEPAAEKPPPPLPPPGEWLSATEAAGYLRMSPKALYAHVSRGGPLAQAASRISGRRLRFNKRGLDRALSMCTLRGSTKSARVGPACSAAAKSRAT